MVPNSPVLDICELLLLVVVVLLLAVKNIS